MKILAINGSHRAGKCTAELLNCALEQAATLGAEVELIELSEFDIGYCSACGVCLMKPECSMVDDMHVLVGKMKASDGIILGSPDYFSNVSARMKTFIDRTRFLHMVENQLKGKVGGFVAMAGLNNCGLEATSDTLDRFFATHEMLVVHPRPTGPVLGSGVNGSVYGGLREDGRIAWRRCASEDETAMKFSRQLGIDMVELIQRLAQRQ